MQFLMYLFLFPYLVSIPPTATRNVQARVSIPAASFSNHAPDAPAHVPGTAPPLANRGATFFAPTRQICRRTKSGDPAFPLFSYVY